MSAPAMSSLGAEDPALLAAPIGELDRRIDSWPGTDNDPIFDQLLAARAELRAELAFFVEVNAALSDIRVALDTGGWGVRRDDLFDIRDTFGRLTPRGADEVMSRLTERELDVWVDQMQEGTLNQTRPPRSTNGSTRRRSWGLARSDHRLQETRPGRIHEVSAI